MSDQTGTDGASATTDTTAGTAPAAEDVKALPDWAQTLIGNLRKENGTHRTAKTAAEKAAEEWQGKFAQQEAAVQDVTGKLGKAELDVVKLKAALAAKQTGDQALVFAERLQGGTPEEIAADAAKLAAFFNAGGTATTSTVKPDPSQGQGGSDMALNGDPLEQSLRNALGIQ